jgi:hypothetical protein
VSIVTNAKKGTLRSDMQLQLRADEMRLRRLYKESYILDAEMSKLENRIDQNKDKLTREAG